MLAAYADPRVLEAVRAPQISAAELGGEARRLRRGAGAALRAAARAAARSGVAVAIDDASRALPPFDPDLEPRPPESVRRFPAPGEIVAMMRAAGFAEVAFDRLTFGIVALFRGQATQSPNSSATDAGP